MFTTCSHTLESGATCNSPAVRGTALCYHHTPRETIRRAPRRASASFELPVLDSRNSILFATNEVLQRLAEGSMKRSEAETLLRALKMATRIMGELEQECDEPDSFFDDSDLGGADLSARTAPRPEPSTRKDAARMIRNLGHAAPSIRN
ncbi:hypothetical protein [Occallatibacter savannae]|uniref:hypothetical protein n=1 Tax=Occallatibacter savannae TaxID=1002691 RepID=UPI000D69B7B2|nr:hypothetical protein [Occallatibacter savannae]